MKTNHYSIREIEKTIHIIGEQLVKCNHLCRGNDIVCDRNTGQIPRCLFFEYKGRDIKMPGVVVVGTNPGIASIEEKNNYAKWFEDGVFSYAKVANRFLNGGYNKVTRFYYSPVRSFLTSCQLEGPILWTELVHCEKSGAVLDDKTIKFCSSHYLKQQLTVIPTNWLVLAASAEAYKVLIPLCKERTLLGFDHPNSRAKKKIQTAARENPSYFIEKIQRLQPGIPNFWRYEE